MEQTLHVVALLEDYATAPAAPHMRRSDIAKARRISQRCVLRSATSTPSNSPLSIANEILDLIAAGATAERIERAARSHRLRTAAIAGCARS